MAMSYTTADAVKYKKTFTKYVKDQVKLQGWEISENRFQHYYMDCIFYFPRIDMDANNYFKCMADAITDSECVWIDDVQLCERVQGIYYDTENPRIEMIITPVDYIGIFQNISQLEEFKTNCIQCTRYKNGKCSLFNKSQEGRIQEEIQNLTCTKFNRIKGEK